MEKSDLNWERRIAARVILVLFHHERSKAPNFDPVSVNKDFGHRFENQIDDFLGFAQRKICLLGDTHNQIRFVHDRLQLLVFILPYELPF